jgi:hypothetical protein
MISFARSLFVCFLKVDAFNDLFSLFGVQSDQLGDVSTLADSSVVEALISKV